MRDCWKVKQEQAKRDEGKGEYKENIDATVEGDLIYVAADIEPCLYIVS